GVGGGDALQIVGMGVPQPELSSLRRAEFVGCESGHRLDVRADEMHVPQRVGAPGDIRNVGDQRPELRLAFPQGDLRAQACGDVAEAPYPPDALTFGRARRAIALDETSVVKLVRSGYLFAVSRALDHSAERIRIPDQLHRVLEAAVRIARFADVIGHAPDLHEPLVEGDESRV